MGFLKVLGLAVVAVVALSAFAAAPVCAAKNKKIREANQKTAREVYGFGISRISKTKTPSEQVLPALGLPRNKWILFLLEQRVESCCEGGGYPSIAEVLPVTAELDEQKAA